MKIKPLSQNLSKRLNSSRILSFASHVLTGSAAGQLILLLSMPLLSRIYSPDDYGIFATYSSALTVLIAVTVLRLDSLIPTIRSDNESINVTRLGLFLCLSAFILLSVIVNRLDTGYALIDKVINSPISFLLPIAVLLSGIYQILSGWAVRKEASLLIGRTKLSQSIGSVVAQTSFGFFGNGPIGLGLGQILYQSIGIKSLFMLFSKESKDKIKLSDMIATLKQHKDFIILGFLSSVANILVIHLLIFFLSNSYGAKVVGWTLLAQRILGIPVDLICTAMGQALLSRSSSRSSDELKDTFLELMKYLIPMSVAISIFSLILPLFIPAIFGNQWEEVGDILKYLGIMYSAKIISSPISVVLIVLGRYRQILYIDILRLFLVYVTMVNFNTSYKSAILSYSAAMTFFYIVYIFYTYYFVAVSRKR
ncbi:lipopolysaccharide biosynthesis protein [Deinococcus seoulensis]|nr:hypothetical protein [Deinococcus seoulensis]